MDLYSVLWLDKWASKEDIKKAYRKLAMQYHPDRTGWNKEAEKKFKEINEAYSVLWDDQKRQQYDMFGSTNWWWNPFGWSGFWWWVDVDLWDIFESFFGGWFSSGWSRKRQTTFRWEDIETQIDIDLKTSILGWKQKLTFNKKETCAKCDWEWWSGKKTCNKCNWKWKVTYTSQSMFGTIQQTATCDECHWTWETFENICESCHWEKRKTIKKEIEIEIPAWIDNWMVIKLTWEANHWVWTKAHWDLYVRFNVRLEEKGLKRDWVDLYYDLEIDVIEAILWTKKEINIPILWKRTIEIKASTQVNTSIKLSWDWVKHINSDKKWDLIINTQIKIPKKLSKKERELYEAVADEKKIDVNKWWVFKKIFG